MQSPSSPRPAQAVLADTKPPRSRFYMPPSPVAAPQRIWRPSCTHLTMTRAYSDGRVCDLCHRPPAWGWLYRCIQDREALLLDVIQDGRGTDHCFDELGNTLIKHVKAPKRGPEMRSNISSAIKEMTSEQLATYTPAQITAILEQRENLQKAIRKDRGRAVVTMVQGRLSALRPFVDVNTGEHPWVPPPEQECQFKVCHNCRTTFRDRAYLNLDAIVDGEISATAATGFGFHLKRQRPIVDVEIVRNIGLRAVPLKRTPPTPTATTPSSPSVWSVLDLLDDQIETADKSFNYGTEQEQEAPLGYSTRLPPPSRLVPSGISPQRLPEKVITPPPGLPIPATLPNGYVLASACNGDTNHHAENSSSSSSSALQATSELSGVIRPPYTPPPTPQSWLSQSSSDGKQEPRFMFYPAVCDGRSPNSLRTNLQVRDEVFASVLPQEVNRQMWGDGNYSGVPHRPTSCHDIPYQPEEMYDVGLFLPFNQEVYDQARETLLPPPTVEEELFYAEKKTTMEEFEEDEGVFSQEPLEVPEGVAVTEEGVEFASADVMTQV